MRLRKREVLTAMAIAAVAAPLAMADVIYTQALDDSAQGAYSNHDGGQVVADQFTLGTAATITGVEWYGYYGADLGTSITSLEFELLFFGSSSGLPGTSIATESVDVAYTVESAGGSDAGTDVYKFVATISSLSLDASTEYWLSISESDSDTTRSGDTQWLWNRSALSGTYATDVGPALTSWSAASPGNFAFTLVGTSVVPLPPAAWLGLGLLGMAVIARRRRPRG